MALSATVEWDVRTSGDDSNGGGFNSGASGTDYSQQDSAQVSFSDLVIDGADNTKLTSALNPFTSAHVGNVLNVTGGTGFTTGRYQVVSVVAAVATMDRAVGTVGSTGGAGKLGGALATIGAAAGPAVSGNVLHVKAGTYTFSATVTFSVGVVTLRGYQTTHSDGGTKPLVTTATNSTDLFHVTGGGGYAWLYVENLSLSNTASTRAVGLAASGNYAAFLILDCVFDGFSYAVNANGAIANSVGFAAINSEFKNCATAAVALNIPSALFHGCYFHDCTQDGIEGNASNTCVAVSACIFANIGKYAVWQTSGEISAFGCSFYNCGLTYSGHPFPALTVNAGAKTYLVVNSIFFGGAKAYLDTGTSRAIGRNNAVDAAGMGADVYHSLSDKTLTSDPFSNPASGDFSLNNTAGGGALCAAAGSQW